MTRLMLPYTNILYEPVFSSNAAMDDLVNLLQCPLRITVIVILMKSEFATQLCGLLYV